jgi:predicted dehydrogenase
MSLRVGLIGYGLFGRHHARAIAQAPGATLAAIACQSRETAEAARIDYPDAAWSSTTAPCWLGETSTRWA